MWNETYRRGNVSTSNALDWGIKIVKGFTFDDLGADFAANTESRKATFYNDKATYIHKFSKSAN
jgi:hypothetical protein